MMLPGWPVLHRTMLAVLAVAGLLGCTTLSAAPPSRQASATHSRR